MERKEKAVNVEKDVRFNMYSKHVYYTVDSPNFINMYLGTWRSGRVLDIDSREQYAFNKDYDKNGWHGYYCLNRIESGTRFCWVQCGLPTMSCSFYENAPIPYKMKWYFLDRKFRDKGLTLQELRKYESVYRKCCEIAREKDLAIRQREVARYKKARAKQEAKQAERNNAIEEMMKR